MILFLVVSNLSSQKVGVMGVKQSKSLNYSGLQAPRVGVWMGANSPASSGASIRTVKCPSCSAPSTNSGKVKGSGTRLIQVEPSSICHERANVVVILRTAVDALMSEELR